MNYLELFYTPLGFSKKIIISDGWGNDYFMVEGKPPEEIKEIPEVKFKIYKNKRYSRSRLRKMPLSTFISLATVKDTVTIPKNIKIKYFELKGKIIEVVEINTGAKPFRCMKYIYDYVTETAKPNYIIVGNSDYIIVGDVKSIYQYGKGGILFNNQNCGREINIVEVLNGIW